MRFIIYYTSMKFVQAEKEAREFRHIISME